MDKNIAKLLKEHPSRYTERFRFSETISIDPLLFVVIDAIDYNYRQAFVAMLDDHLRLASNWEAILSSLEDPARLFDSPKRELIGIMTRWVEVLEDWQPDMNTVYQVINGDDIPDERLLSLLEKHLIIAEGFK